MHVSIHLSTNSWWSSSGLHLQKSSSKGCEKKLLNQQMQWHTILFYSETFLESITWKTPNIYFIIWFLKICFLKANFEKVPFLVSKYSLFEKNWNETRILTLVWKAGKSSFCAPDGPFCTRNFVLSFEKNHGLRAEDTTRKVNQEKSLFERKNRTKDSFLSPVKASSSRKKGPYLNLSEFDFQLVVAF